MRTRICLAVLCGLVVATGLFGCVGGGGESPTDTLAKDDAIPAVPDAPGGDAGETAEKPAGAGQANGQAPKSPDDKPPTGPSGNVAGGEMTVIAELVNVRRGPGMSHESVRTLKKDATVAASSCKQGWCQIGDKEYVAKRFLAP